MTATAPEMIAGYQQVWSPTCLAGRVAVVTGTSSGVGAEATRALAAVGAKVYAFSRGAGPADADPTGVTVLRADAGSEAEIRQAVAEVVAREGHVDIAVANAARYTTKRFTELDTETWLGELAVNLNGVFYLFRAVLDHPATVPDRSLIAIGSTAGERGGSLGHVPYGVAKAGLQGLCKGLAREVGELGARVNVLALGTVDGTVNAQEAHRLKGANYGKAGALRRAAHVSEIAHSIVYLASPASSFVTGSVMRADGGGLYG